MSIISKRAQRFQSSGIRKVFDLAATLKNPINFSIGQPDFGPSSIVQNATINAIRENKSQYTPTQGILELREKIVDKFRRENNIPCSIDNVLITAGTSAGVFLSLAVLVDEEDEGLIPDPFFVEYPELVKFLGGKPVFINTYPSFQLDPKTIENACTEKTKVLIINSPNNPTGAVYSENTLRAIVDIARKKNLIVISDEIYEKFVYDKVHHFSIGSVYPNTITRGGLSKSGGMPGWRLGWATGPTEIIEKMKELQQYTFVCAPSIVQYAALSAIDDSIKKHVEEFQKRRDLVIELFSKKFSVIKPYGAFYMMVDVGDGDKFAEWAARQNVLVIPGSVFSTKKTHVRISYALAKTKIIEGINVLLKYPC